MKILLYLLINITMVHTAYTQEPFSYKPKDIPADEIPLGLTAKEYINKVYMERHFPTKITYRVLGEDGKPVPDANVDIGFFSLLHSDDLNNYKGKTNKLGLFTAESRSAGYVEVEVSKKGYYQSRSSYHWDSNKLNNSRNTTLKKLRKHGWRPWNPTVDIMIKKIGNPIPMIVRSQPGAGGQIPKMNTWIGLDLVVGDWVEPHGRGKISDILVYMSERFTNDSDNSLITKIKFSGEGNGLIRIKKLVGSESFLKFPRTAPLDGYVNQFEIKKIITPKAYSLENSLGIGVGYFLRIRTNKNKMGRITSAKYGKIIENFDIESILEQFRKGNKNNNSFFYIQYYLNMNNNDPNLEGDMKNNLAPEAEYKTFSAP